MSSSAMRVAVTGAAGMLGREVCAEVERRHFELIPWTREQLDIRHADPVRHAIEMLRPDVVIHAAAFTAVDDCESDPETAFAVNTEGTRHFVEACRRNHTRVLMVSTDYVFAGDKEGPYVEDDATGPLSVYGRSKRGGEEAVLELGERGIVARTAWVYADHGKNFLNTMLGAARAGKSLRVVEDQVGSPTFAADLAVSLLDLAESRGSGVFHVTNQGETSWYGFARAIFEEAGLSPELAPCASSEFPRPAPRPANSVLSNTRFDALGIAHLAPWREGLRRCLERMSLTPADLS